MAQRILEESSLHPKETIPQPNLRLDIVFPGANTFMTAGDQTEYLAKRRAGLLHLNPNE